MYSFLESNLDPWYSTLDRSLIISREAKECIRQGKQDFISIERIFAYAAVPIEENMIPYIAFWGNEYLKAVNSACGEGDLGAVMTLCPYVEDINTSHRGIYSSIHYSCRVLYVYIYI